MAVRAKVDPIDRDIDLILSADLSPAAQSAALADFAEDEFDRAQDINRSALGQSPEYESFVDGRASRDLKSVKPDGVIVFEFELFNEMLAWIDFMLLTNSPVKSGRDKRSHILLADGVEIDVNAPLPDAREFVYLNTQPYARKIEQGQSKQAPAGVYQAVQAMASKRFGNIGKITFTYRRLASAANGKGKDNDRQPAIVIAM